MYREKKNYSEVLKHLSGLRCADAKMQRGIVRFVEKCFGEFCQNSGVMLNLRIARRADLCTGVTRVAKDTLPRKTIKYRFSRGKRTGTLPNKTIKYRFVRGEERATVLSESKSKTGRNGDAKAAALQSRLSRATKQIQGLSMFIKSISIDRCRIKFGMTVSCAKRTEKNLSLFTSHFSREGKRVAFTLAEVLITLGIIGVVAAMTLPSVINKYRSFVLHKQFLKSYSNLQQVILFIKNDLGIENLIADYATPVPGKGYPYANAFYAEFDKYIKVVKKVPIYSVKNYNKTADTEETRDIDNPRPIYVLPDGSSVGRAVNGGTVHLSIDVNGPDKAPNRFGFDVFMFNIAENDTVAPIKQYKTYTTEELERVAYPWLAGAPCSVNSTQRLNGIGCSWYAVNNINPDDETKKYWDSLPW